MRRLTVHQETWPILGNFTISRMSATECHTLMVEIREGDHMGRGECEAHECDASFLPVVAGRIENVRQAVEAGADRQDLYALLPPGPERNALDCALWDLEAKKNGARAWDMAGIPLNSPIETAYTIGIDTAEAMAKKAARHHDFPLLKVKLGASGSLERLEAVRKAAPNSRLIVDANESFTLATLDALAAPFKALGVELIEQPLPANADAALEGYSGPIPLCADESCTDRASLPALKNRYDFINIKLDKTGGLTEALALAREAKKLGLRLMVGCMTGTSLAMAPAMVIASIAEVCDLDGPLLLARDREHSLAYHNGKITPPAPTVWG
jgi:L-alanine-DL-glutamate epimerase-like enolase superfamily enzyme